MILKNLDIKFSLCLTLLAKSKALLAIFAINKLLAKCMALGNQLANKQLT